MKKKSLILLTMLTLSNLKPVVTFAETVNSQDETTVVNEAKVTTIDYSGEIVLENEGLKSDVSEETLHSESSFSEPQKIEESIENVEQGIVEPKLETDVPAAVAETIVYQGVFGTSPWTLDDEGVLRIESGEFAFALGHNAGATNLFDTDISASLVKKIIFEGPVKAYYYSVFLFANFTELEQIENFELFDTSEVTSMSHMFFNAKKLISLDLSGFDTSSVEDMSNMFEGANISGELNLSNFDTSNVADMSYMFSGFGTSSFLDLTNFDTSKVANMSSMFRNYNGMGIDLSHFNTANVTDMSSMFQFFCNSELDLSSFDTAKVENMRSMFEEASLIEVLEISNFNTQSVSNMEKMFSGTTSLQRINMSGFDTSNVATMQDMFRDTPNLDNLDLLHFNTLNVKIMSGMFKNFGGQELDLSSFVTPQVTTMTDMFSGAAHLEVLDISNFDTSSVVSMNGMFSSASKLKALDVRHFDTSEVRNMSSMFYKLESITELDVSSFRTSNVVTMDFMFSDLPNVDTLDLTTFDTSKVWTMFAMFQNFGGTKIDVSSFDTANVISMTAMFTNTSRLNTLDVSHFNTSKVTSMYAMFNGTHLAAIDVSNFDTSNVVLMQSMFRKAENLKMLDLSNFDCSSLFGDNNAGYQVGMKGMLEDCPSLEILRLGTNFKFISATYLGAISRTEANLLEIPQNATYTGKWRQVGVGTLEQPNGPFIYTSTELMENYDGATMAGTYVWQKVDNQGVPDIDLSLPPTADVDPGETDTSKSLATTNSKNSGNEVYLPNTGEKPVEKELFFVGFVIILVSLAYLNKRQKKEFK